jgi:transcriptional regulator with XRE-family HTH domain
MSSELGDWLRRQREDRGWTRAEMARQLIRAAKARGDTSVPGVDNISHNIYRWERGVVGPSERFRHYYCVAFAIPFSQFGIAAGPSSPNPGPNPSPDPSPAAPATPAHHGTPGGCTIRREVLMAAHEGSEHAERAEQRGIGEATLEQFRADTRRLSVEYMTGEPYAMYREMRRVRNRITEALDRRQWPQNTAELYLLAGCLNALMAAAATNLGVSEAAEELARSGWAYATIIDHHPLMARIRMCGAYTAYWSGRPEQSRTLARAGLEFLTDGQNAAQLHLQTGLASARLGDARSARQAIAAAHEAREREHHDELLEIGGEFGFSRAIQSYYAGFILSEAQPGTGSREAIAELERATELYRAGPGPGEHHSRRCQMLAHTDLAIARLRSGALDAAAAALEPVMALSPGERTAVQVQRLSVLRHELTGTIFRGSPQASDLAEQVADFSRQTLLPREGETMDT